jgi:hypothetical protein
MRSALQYLVPILGVIVVWLLAGAASALWLAALLLACIGASTLAGQSQNLPLVRILETGSLILAGVGAVLLFMFFGSLPAVAALVLFAAYVFLRPHAWDERPSRPYTA